LKNAELSFENVTRHNFQSKFNEDLRSLENSDKYKVNP